MLVLVHPSSQLLQVASMYPSQMSSDLNDVADTDDNKLA